MRIFSVNTGEQIPFVNITYYRNQFLFIIFYRLIINITNKTKLQFSMSFCLQKILKFVLSSVYF